MAGAGQCVKNGAERDRPRSEGEAQGGAEHQHADPAGQQQGLPDRPGPSCRGGERRRVSGKHKSDIRLGKPKLVKSFDLGVRHLSRIGQVRLT
ncbi:hypothetical protein GCM10009760_13000 [Kitasatospora kazusensis]|uniref:Uncharacterized protein n=1 Tax=Kitasatospora kazusensis TaxID=407974 RepID=A0ABN2Z0S4_9ACTN